MIELHHCDNMEFMAGIPDGTFPVIITDPPYGISMMGMRWDYNVPSVETFAEMLRVTKPGGIMLCFAGARTQHRMGVNIEDAGWRLCDTLMWVFGSGMGIALRIDLAIEKSVGAERERVGLNPNMTNNFYINKSGWDRPHRMDPDAENKFITTPATDAAKKWDGWFSPNLKKAYEPILVCQKMLDGTYANNVQKHGCGALHFEGVRIGTEEVKRSYGKAALMGGFRNKKDLIAAAKINGKTPGDEYAKVVLKRVEKHESKIGKPEQPTGRYPSHLLIDDHVASVIDEQSGYSKTKKTVKNDGRKTGKNRVISSNNYGKHTPENSHNDAGGASRFFQRINFEEEDKVRYCPKAPQKEVNYGLEESNTHPTIKPLSLMRWLVRLAKLPENTTVFDPFGGCFSTMWACIKEGVDGVSCEREEEYFKIGKKRIKQAELDYENEQKQTKLFPDFEGEKKVKPKPKQVGLFE